MSEPGAMSGVLGAVAAKAWRYKGIVFAAIAVALLLAVAYLHVAAYRYDVSLKVTPVTDQAKGRNGLLGNLASVAGIDLPGAGGGDDVEPFDLFLQGIYTRQTADLLAADQPLMHALFPAEWDDAAGQWQNPSPFKTEAINTIKSVIGIPQREWSPPDGARVQEFITLTVSVARDPRSPVVTITMRHTNRDVAKRFLSRLLAVNDNWLRQQTLIRTSKYIEYLNVELQKVTVEEYKRALGSILSEQEKRRMFASSPSVNYSAQIFEAPTAAVRPASPNPAMILIMALFLGAMAGIALALFAGDWLARRLSFLGR